MLPLLLPQDAGVIVPTVTVGAEVFVMVVPVPFVAVHPLLSVTVTV